MRLYEFDSIEIEGVRVYQNILFRDSRGYFQEWHKHSQLPNQIDEVFFRQANFSKSKKNVIRGLHFSLSHQYKLITVLDGVIKDVLVDLRSNSKSFLRKFEIIISSEEPITLFVPPHIAHGFSVLSKTASIAYLVSTEYEPSNEIVIHPLDKDLAIDWKVKQPIISEKDRFGHTLNYYLNNFENFSFTNEAKYDNLGK